MIRNIWKDRKIVWELAKNDCKARFSASILGVVWTILQPLINMLVIWLVFQVGFKSSNLEGDIPFIIWYMPAFLIWNYFQEAVSQSTNSLMEYSYLVKKVNFNVEIIPTIKIISNALIHLFFILFIVFVNLCYGKYPTVYYVQVFYYFFCAMALSMALGWLCSAIAPFVADVANVVSIVIQLGFWVTPIFWDPSSLTDVAKMLLKVNPMYYVCMGYRDCFVYDTPFVYHPLQTLYFWIVTVTIWIIGTRIFKKSKKYFDDVL